MYFHCSVASRGCLDAAEERCWGGLTRLAKWWRSSRRRWRKRWLIWVSSLFLSNPQPKLRGCWAFVPRVACCEKQGTPWWRQTGTSKRDLLKVTQEALRALHGSSEGAGLWQTGLKDVCGVVGKACVFLQPGYCVDSISWWFTGVIQRLFTHKRKPWGKKIRTASR